MEHLLVTRRSDRFLETMEKKQSCRIWNKMVEE